MSEHQEKHQRSGLASGTFKKSSIVSGWQDRRLKSTRAALAEVEAERDDTITYLSTLRVVMEVLERSHDFHHACQEIAEALIVQIGAETCAIAVRDRPEQPFQLRGFANQSQRIGASEAPSSVTESTWLTAATLMAASDVPTMYRQAPDGTLTAVAEMDDGAGLLGLPYHIGGERNGGDTPITSSGISALIGKNPIFGQVHLPWYG